MDWVANLLVAFVSLIALVTDFKWRRIPNWLTFPAIVVGILLNAIVGWDGLVRSVGGLAFALAFMLPFFALDLLKAGDVKLVLAWGTIKGLGQPAWQTFALWAFLYGALLGGLMSLLVLVQKKAVSETWKRVWAIFGLMLGAPSQLTKISDSSPMRMPMPYGIALSLGSFLAIAMEWWFGRVCPFIAS
ncbi:MAG: A24 family peptidase [Armatimonadetes bacterium]|nr:A24 family peptidase [Armatimonadota bacterium]MCX7968370.1 A24 family peptidase [Armatimonadota bacterium]MDW8142189.1 A24 family peptidase [Armatimonadota bacterium]